MAFLGELGAALSEGLRRKEFGADYKEKQALEQAQISQAPARQKALELENENAGLKNESGRFDLDQARSEVEQKRALVKAGVLPVTDLKVAEFMLQQKESGLRQKLVGSQIDMNNAHAKYFERGPQPGKPMLKQNIDGSYVWMYPPGSGGGNVTTDVKAPLPAAVRTQAEARQLIGGSIDAIENLSKKIITRNGPGQRLDAAGRAVSSAFGNDPEYKTYQDARMALAGNLAVAQQGSRPSDADIRAIWLPFVPDPIGGDTAESSAMKWKLVRQMSHAGGKSTVSTPGPAIDGGGVQPAGGGADWEQEWLSKYGGGGAGAD